MRRIILSTLFLSTVLLNAQTGTKGQSVTLVAHNDAAGLASSTASQPATDADATTHGRRISTGVIGPKLISEPDVQRFSGRFPNPRFGHATYGCGFSSR